ncbi:MAG: heavy-metal-associated domain-containing protein [Tannerella sp.]|jgi:copper ion binding protein|nr:heavy-metal-associated domain-containing protein [Tannerella sp.]
MKAKLFVTLLFAMFIGIVSAQNNLQVLVEGMHCGGCAGRVKTAVTAVDGVSDVSVDLEKKVVSISYNSSKVSENDIKTAIGNIAEKFKPADYDPNQVLERTVAFRAGQMHCGGCAGKVNKNIGEEAGVISVDADPTTKRVLIKYDANKVTSDELKADFKKFGYTVSNYWANEIVKYATFKTKNIANVDELTANLEKQDGILDVNVNAEAKVVEIAYHSGKVTAEALSENFKPFSLTLAAN